MSMRAFAALWLAAGLARGLVPENIAARPVPPDGGPTLVKAGLYYIDIGEIDGATETFGATAYLLLEWSDPRLRFSSKEGTRLYQPDSIWTPAVEAINAEKLEDQLPPSCTVRPGGTVYYIRRVVARLNTQMDLRRFPFDRQRLGLVLESARFGADELVFQPDPAQSGLGDDLTSRGWNYSPLEWQVKNRPFARTQEDYSRLVFTFEARRNPTYFIWKVIFPVMIFVLLTWAVFWLPVREVQTTLLVSITVLLTAVAFGNVTDALLPKLGYRTWLDDFQLGSFLFIVATVVETITMYGIHAGGATARAEGIRRMLRIVYPAAYAIFCGVLLVRACG